MLNMLYNIYYITYIILHMLYKIYSILHIDLYVSFMYSYCKLQVNIFIGLYTVHVWISFTLTVSARGVSVCDMCVRINKEIL